MGLLRQLGQQMMGLAPSAGSPVLFCFGGFDILR